MFRHEVQDWINEGDDVYQTAYSQELERLLAEQCPDGEADNVGPAARQNRAIRNGIASAKVASRALFAWLAGQPGGLQKIWGWTPALIAEHSETHVIGLPEGVVAQGVAA